MIKKGVYRGGKVHTHEPIVNALTGGNWKTEWSGTKSFGGYRVYEVQRTMDWWPNDNQEVNFEIEEGKVYIKSLGKILEPDEADHYCRSF